MTPPAAVSDLGYKSLCASKSGLARIERTKSHKRSGLFKPRSSATWPQMVPIRFPSASKIWTVPGSSEAVGAGEL